MATRRWPDLVAILALSNPATVLFHVSPFVSIFILSASASFVRCMCWYLFVLDCNCFQSQPVCAYVCVPSTYA